MNSFDVIWRSMGCDNCQNNVYKSGTGPCEDCMICQECTSSENCANCMTPPSAYIPHKGTIQEKAWNKVEDCITDKEYQAFREEYAYLFR